MRSTFKRGPGSGFGLSNLKPPHTLGKEEGETIRGVQRFCSALCVLLWALHTPIWSTPPRYACHPGWGTLRGGPGIPGPPFVLPRPMDKACAVEYSRPLKFQQPNSRCSN